MRVQMPDAAPGKAMCVYARRYKAVSSIQIAVQHLTILTSCGRVTTSSHPLCLGHSGDRIPAKKEIVGKLNMDAILEPAAFRRAQKMLETIFVTASDLRPEHSVALVTGGAILGFDDQVHIDLNRAHTVLSSDEARRFAAELKRIADAIDPSSDRERGD